MSKLAYLNWSSFLQGDGSLGNMGASFVSDPVSVDAQDFSVQITWTAGAAPVGVFSVETSNDGVNYNTVDASLLTPALVQPGDGSGVLSQTIHLSGLRASLARVRYVRTGGGAADTAKGTVKNR